MKLFLIRIIFIYRLILKLRRTQRKLKILWPALSTSPIFRINIFNFFAVQGNFNIIIFCYYSSPTYYIQQPYLQHTATLQYSTQQPYSTATLSTAHSDPIYMQQSTRQEA